MNRLTASSIISVITGLVLAANPAAATPVSYGTGFASALATIDFGGLANGTSIDNTYAAQGVSFTGLYATDQFGNAYPPSVPPAAANFIGNTINPAFEIDFATPVTDADFLLVTDSYGATITSFLNNVQVETTSAGQYDNSGKDYFGFSGSSFDRITLQIAGDGVAFIDNVQIGQAAGAAPAPVPEPASGAVMLAGLAGLMLIGGRRRI